MRDINGNRHNREGFGVRSIIPMGDEVTPRSRDIQGIIEIMGIMEITADKISKKMHLSADINMSIRFHKRANDSNAACCCCIVQRLFPILRGDMNIGYVPCGLNRTYAYLPSQVQTVYSKGERAFGAIRCGGCH